MVIEFYYLFLALLFILLIGLYFYAQSIGNTSNYIASAVSLSEEICYHKREVMRPLKTSKLSQEIRVCLVSGSISENNKRQYALLSHERLKLYTSYHGYSLKYFTTYYDTTAPAIWQKVYAVQEALEEGYDAVVWIDDDIWITDLHTPIEKFLALTDKPLIFAEDMYGPSHNFINTGAYILRNGPLSRKFIKETIDGRLNLYSGIWSKVHFHEQSVMTYLIMSRYRNETIVLKKNLLQSYTLDNSWKKGDFCMHMAGESLEKRNKVFLELSELQE